MSQSRLTINVNCSYVKNWNTTLDFLRKLDPVAVVAVIDNKANVGRVVEIQRALPSAKIICRCVIVVKNPDGSQKELDGGMHLAPQGANDTRRFIVSPGDFLNEWGDLGKNGLTLSYFNEPQTSDASQENIGRMAEHMIQTIGLATQRGISLLVGNWGAGQSPKPMANGQWDARFDDVLTAISLHPELHSVGIHLYAPIDTFNALDSLISRCKALAIKVKCHVSEFGFDTDGSPNGFNGYRSRGYSGAQFGGWCVDKVKNVYGPYFQNGTLESVAVFGWGYAASFPNFDVEQDTDWQATVLVAKAKGDLTIETKQPTPVPKPTPTVPAPAYMGIPQTIVVKGSANWNLRTEPDIHADVVGSVKPDETIDLYTQTIQPNGGNNFFYVHRVAAPTGESVSGWLAYVLPVTAPLPPVVTPPSDPPPVIVDVPPLPTAPYLEVTSVAAARMATNARALAAAYLASAAAKKQSAESDTLLAQDHLSEAQIWDDIANQTAKAA